MSLKLGRRLCGALAALAVLTAVTARSAPLPDASLEYKVKATYLYKFGAYVEWPQSAFASPTSALNVCVAGKDPFGGVLDKVAEGQRIAEHPVVVRHLNAVIPNSGCQILFLAGSTEQSIAQGLDIVRGMGVLTVTEGDLSDHSGVVRFVTDDNRVGFNIDERAASRDGLMISSKLLGLAASFRQKS